MQKKNNRRITFIKLLFYSAKFIAIKSGLA